MSNQLHIIKIRIIQKIINILYNSFRYFVNDGTVDIKSKPYPLTNIYVGRNGNLSIGKNTGVAPYTYIRVTKEVYIGDYVRIAPCCFIEDDQQNYKYKGKERKLHGLQKDCIIKDGAWIGFGSVIISSIIGENSVIGANSVVINKIVPDDHIFVGDSRLNYKLKKIKYEK